MIICENNTVFAKSDFWSKTRQPAPVSPTFFAVDLADLYSALSFYNPDCFHFFSRSFFSLTAFSSSIFHHQLSSHPIVQFRSWSATHLLATLTQYTRQLHSTMSLNVSSSSDSFSTTFLQKASLTPTSFNFHHFINFLPNGFLFSSQCHAFLPPVDPCVVGLLLLMV